MYTTETKNNTSIKSLLEMIDCKKAKLDSHPLSESKIAQLMKDSTVEYIFNSNAIEGNILTLQETDMVLRGLTIDGKPMKDQLEATGHKKAFDFVMKLAKHQTPMSEEIIKQIHYYLVFADKSTDQGVYRQTPVYIAGAAHTTSPPALIGQQMKELLATYEKSTAHIVTKQALFHIAFEAIHPFRDGNGRAGRLLVNLELMKTGYPPICISFADRYRYYNAFTSYHTVHNLSPMVELFAQNLNLQLDRYLLGDD